MKVSSLHSDEYLDFYQGYINNIPKDQSLGMLFQQNKNDILEILNKISAEQLKYRYAEGKWNVAEVLQHLIDVERIFQYRALCIARGEKNPLPGFDHDNYVQNSFGGERNLDDLITEFKIVRNSTIQLYNSFAEPVLEYRGLMNGAPASVRAIGFIIVGHMMHHQKILLEKYL
ncbi:DinB family protein [Autumnicola musiva]|uniref:DinB family protein n=1 Tax=Autumnicola musiva TaxID=3075589 RepID=A0ABU3D7A0_9FLAO|nr:DinB family protein [Zunongwangia sp. F117]MDT0676878.1 DinB family protein [Zunongwangia sp. F117]